MPTYSLRRSFCSSAAAQAATLVLLAACAEPDAIPGSTDRLAYLSVPATQIAGQPTRIKLGLIDRDGRVVENDTSLIIVRWSSTPNGMYFGLMDTLRARQGVVRISLSLNSTGIQYFDARAGADTTWVRDSVLILPTIPVALMVCQDPWDHYHLGDSLLIAPSIQVQVRDVWDNLATQATPTINVSLDDPAPGESLIGTRTATAVAGVATFPGLRLSGAAGRHIVLLADAPGLFRGGTVINAFSASAGGAVLANRYSCDYLPR